MRINTIKERGSKINIRDDYHLDSPEGVKLAEALATIGNDPVQELKTLQPYIDDFLNNTIIMAENPIIRNARLALLRDVCTEILKVGDVTKLKKRKNTS